MDGNQGKEFPAHSSTLTLTRRHFLLQGHGHETTVYSCILRMAKKPHIMQEYIDDHLSALRLKPSTMLSYFIV